MKTFSILAIFICLTATSFAGNNAWNGPVTIGELRAGSNGNTSATATGVSTYTFTTTNQSVISLTSCNNDIYVVRGTEYKSVYATLLAAYLTNRQVDIYVNGCDSAIGRPIVTDVMFVN